MELLILLISRQGSVVTRSEIAEVLWEPGVFVDIEHGINTAVRKIRYVLRDDPGRPRYVQTISGKGYRFVPDVVVVSAAPEVSVNGHGSMAGLQDQLPAAQNDPPQELQALPSTPPAKRRLTWLPIAALALVISAAVTVFLTLRPRKREMQYTQLTDFADSASAPALSPDGRTMAFIRGPDAFFTSDQIYIKVLPDGEPRKLTDDSRWKYAPTFSPDGSQLAYTILDAKRFDTKFVSVRGGKSHLFLANAAGLSWLGPEQLLFSYIREGWHLGVVRGTRTGEHLHDLYFPENQQGLALYSFASPDRRVAIVVEMGNAWNWSPCKLISLNLSFAPRQVGPSGSCTAAAWSPDGSFMYFTVSVKGARHLWRQAYPNGTPEQITTGPTEEEGVLVEPGGGSVLTALGKRENSLGLHEANKDRVLVSEGEILGWRMDEDSPPCFSPDGKFIYYLARQKQGTLPELWRVDTSSARSEAVFPGIWIKDYDLSPDGKEIFYSEISPSGTNELRIASLDGNSPPVHIPVPRAHLPHFGPRGKLLVVREEAHSIYLEAMNRDGSDLQKAIAQPIIDDLWFSPSRDWVVTSVAPPGNSPPFTGAFPLNGGPPREMCAEAPCFPIWSPDGKWLLLYVNKGSDADASRTLAIPLAPGQTLPDLPVGGIRPNPEAKEFPGAFYVDHVGFIKGSTPFRYAYLDNRDHRNIYRVSLP